MFLSFCPPEGYGPYIKRRLVFPHSSFGSFCDPQEIEAALGERKQAETFCRAYGIREEGNCTLSEMSDPHNEFGGKNVPILLNTIQSLAREVGSV